MPDPWEHLARALNPRTVAVVGDKRANGYLWLRNMSTFTGKLYSVQVDPAEIAGIEELGVPNYPSLADVPDEIDYVLCAVPRTVAPRIVADCAAKGVGGVALFTSGFAETGEEEGVRLQAEIGRISREAGLALIGPNCMGVYRPKLGVRQSGEQPAGEAGLAGFISQSGTHAINFSLIGAAQGVRISTSVSIGNAEVLDVPDYLDYLTADPDTRVIAMYVEGVKDGRRFLDALRRAAQAKPVAVWKGGVTDAGARATASHTASLATSNAVWNVVVRQAGALSADSMDDTIDLLKALLFCKPARGGRMGLMAMTGGQSVVITDAFARAGLEVPLFTAESYEKLAEFFNIIGGSYRNPLDMGGTIGFGGAPGQLERLLQILDEDAHVDAIAMELASGFLARRWQADPSSLDRLLDLLVAHRERSAKPFLTILHPGHVEDVTAQARARVVERGLAVFHSFERAARALARAIGYWNAREGMD
ncbi:MAG: CoA-binding protein [Chloroflexi bacterium]|nr:CoA-binding protein [Chloroflexota bacterium]